MAQQEFGDQRHLPRRIEGVRGGSNRRGVHSTLIGAGRCKLSAGLNSGVGAEYMPARNV
jgi:hypothetical protein